MIVHVLLEGMFYDEGSKVQSVNSTREIALERCKNDGYVWSEDNQCFLNYELERYRELEEFKIDEPVNCTWIEDDE